MTSEQHRRVLIADDSSEIRGILITALRQQRLIIDEAVDGGQAIELLKENTYDVVLLDLFMPGVDGFAVLDAIDQSITNPPIVLVVTGADRGTLNRLDARKIHGVINKPFDPLEIASIVANCADLRGRSTFETMALATMISGAPLIAWLGKW